MGSSGYGSNGSHEQQVGISSSSESSNNMGKPAEETAKVKPPRTFQEICKGVHMLKNQDSQVSLPSQSPSASPSPLKPELKKIIEGEATCLFKLELVKTK